MRNRATRWSTARSSRLRRPSARICPSALGRGRFDRSTGGVSSRSFPSGGRSTTGGGCPTRSVSDPRDPRGWNWRTPSTGTGRRPPGVPTVRTDSGWTRTTPSPAVSERSGGSPLRPPLPDVAARVEGGLVRGGPPGGQLGLENGQGDRIGSASFDPAPLAGLFVTRKY